MRDYNYFFKEEYQFALKETHYMRIENPTASGELALKSRDDIKTEIKGDQLDVTFERDVFFEPEAIFSLRVAFCVVLSFRDEVSDEERKSVNWNEMLVGQYTPFLSNIISRAVSLIATITSSFGQQPLITPNVFTRTMG